MAGLGEKLKAFTLIEALIAVIIISVVMTLGVMTYLNVTVSMVSLHDHLMLSKARFYLDSLGEEAMNEEINWIDQYGSNVFISAEPYDPAIKDLWHVKAQVSDSLGNEALHQKLLYVPGE
ncbi:MAG: type II secretion system protein [Cyclobacteriaceae bacterium]|nr:type II secretion system protein [Cyclobacteriaceae bacterium HetDA_MAG_MS6]